MDNQVIQKITAPDGFVVDREKTTSTEIYFKKADKFDALSTVEDCKAYYSDKVKKHNLDMLVEAVPNDYSENLISLISLLYCRDAWWKADNYKPDFCVMADRYAITSSTGKSIFTMDAVAGYYLLTFRTKEIRDRFLETYETLIKEALIFI
jgi:hypothetical protein